MGIPGFSLWFSGKNKESYVPLNTLQIDHLYIDLNSVLHNTLRAASTHDQFHKQLHRRLDQILKMTGPRKTVMIAVDGPAPLAKLITQRERRQAVARKEIRTKALPAAADGGGGGGGGSPRRRPRPKPVVSSTALTPGTEFMHDVCVSLGFFLASRASQAKWRDVRFELSGATVAGEGEVKILGRLSRPWDHVHPGDTHVMVGDDADLILMALMSPARGVHVLNSALADNTKDPSTYPVMSVERLHGRWAEMGLAALQDGRNALEPDAASLSGAKADLALIAILSSGNDYLPSVMGTSMDNSGGGLWRRYLKMRKTPQYASRSIVHACDHTPCAEGPHGPHRLVRTAAIDADFLADLLGSAAAAAEKGDEEEGVEREADAGAGSGGEEGEDAAGSTGASESEGPRASGPDEPEAMEGVETAAAAAPAALAVAAMAAAGGVRAGVRRGMDYVQGLLWTLSMYFSGECPDYRWSYIHGPPAADNITSALSRLGDAAPAPSGPGSPRLLRLSDFYPPAPGTPGCDLGAVADLGPLPPHVCSLALLPSGTEGYVPEDVRWLMQEGSPVFDLYKECPECTRIIIGAAIADREYKAVLSRLDAAAAALDKAHKAGAGADQVRLHRQRRSCNACVFLCLDVLW